MRVELYVLDVGKLFASLLRSAETEFNANVMINVNSIHYHLLCDTRLLKNESLFGRIQLHKHTDVGIICFCVEVNVLDV